MGFVLMDVITESMGIGNLIPAASCDLNLTGTTKGLLTSMVFFGDFFMVKHRFQGRSGDIGQVLLKKILGVIVFFGHGEEGPKISTCAKLQLESLAFLIKNQILELDLI